VAGRIGFAGYALWRATEAVVGHTEERSTGKRIAKRVVEGVKAAHLRRARRPRGSDRHGRRRVGQRRRVDDREAAQGVGGRTL
jgi:hypothetical protein